MKKKQIYSFFTILILLVATVLSGHSPGTRPGSLGR